MESYTMLLDEKNLYCQNDYTTKGNLQIQCNCYQITNGIFHRTRTKYFKVLKHKKPRIVKAILRKKNGGEGISLPESRLYCKAIVIKSIWHWEKTELQISGTGMVLGKDSTIDQWNRTENRVDILKNLQFPKGTGWGWVWVRGMDWGLYFCFCGSTIEF